MARKEMYYRPIPIRTLGLPGQDPAESKAFPSLVGTPLGLKKEQGSSASAGVPRRVFSGQSFVNG